MALMLQLHNASLDNAAMQQLHTQTLGFVRLTPKASAIGIFSGR
jgi:hypothetical protein